MRTRRLSAGALRALALAIIVLVAIVDRDARAAEPADTIAQRMIACTGCHDSEGRRGRDAYYPRIAGKPAGYLYNQLLNFRDGRRFYALMTYLVDLQSDAYLKEMAEHFAAIDVPYPSPEPSKAEPAVLERGRTLAASGDAARKLPACAECHGAGLTGVAPSIPGLLGLPRDYLVAQFNAWRSGARRAQSPDCMADIANRLTVEEIAAVSSWLSSQPVPARAKAERATARLPIECGGVDAARTGSAR